MVAVSYLLCLFFGLFPGCPGTFHPSSVALCPKGVVVPSSGPVSHSGAQYPLSSKTKDGQSQIIRKMCIFVRTTSALFKKIFYAIPVMAKMSFEQPLQSVESHEPSEIRLIWCS